MKKLTKRVQAGGLWFDVPSNTQWVTINSDGELFSSEQRKKPIAGISNWMFSNSFRKSLFGVELCGKDWLECCWFVGDQIDAEDSERREWMARGVDGFERYCVHLSDCSGDKRWIGAARNAALYANTMRAGEVDL